MPDRIVYLVSTLPKKARESDLEFVDDGELGRLLSEGWETGTTIPDRTVKVAGKSVKATMMVLKRASENRGMVMREDREVQRRERPAGGSMVTFTDDFGQHHEAEPGRALAHVLNKMERALTNLGDPGHLGGAKNHNIPGLQIISGEMIAKAWDMGLLAQRRGDSEDSCPFPPRTEVAQRWMGGFRKGQAALEQDADPVAAKEAYKQGLQVTKDFGPDDEVTCPHPQGSPLREHWLNGFKDGGGKVR